MPIISKPSYFFGHQNLTRKVLTAFMDYFSKRIYIERYAANGLTYRYVQVPIHYAQRDRFFQVLKGVNLKHEGGGDAGIALDLNRVLPRMSLGLGGISTNAEKKLNKFHKIKKAEFDDTSLTRNYIPVGVPVTLDLELNIITKSQDDTFQIFEQIIPYFGSPFSLDVNLLEGYEAESVSFAMSSISPDATDEFGVDVDRVFVGSLGFSANVNYYLARTDINSQNYITQIDTRFYVGEESGTTYKKFRNYILTADNLLPIDGLDIQPSTTTIVDAPFPGGVFAAAFNSAFA